ncbi:MAG: sigma-70 family RNA polymerase sigma factor [candidate division WOR-3 bacterium]|nr:sigma-70 family RNA polymerase sigma factor [candidate division WOR-3 bacterium]
MKANPSLLNNDIRAQEMARIVEAAKHEDDDALAKLCKYVYGKLFGYIYYRVRQREDAEDLTSEVVLKMVKSLNTQKGNFLGWIYRIARNQIIDFYRQRARKQEISLESLKKDIPSPEEPRDYLTENRMKEALAYLTQDQSDVITLKFFQEYNNEEIAKIMGKTVGAIKVLQFRALKALREYFRKERYETRH